MIEYITQNDYKEELLMVSRREFIARTSALSAACIVPSSVFARNQLILGSTTIDMVVDGRMNLPARMLASNYDSEEVQDYLTSINAPKDEINPPCNLTLVQNGDHTILFDVGGGFNFMPTLGNIVDSLDAIGVSPEDITDVVFTHAHPDHIWGLLDDFDDLLFGAAQYHMSSKEFDYWMNPNTLSSLPEDRQAFAAGAKRNIEVIAEQLNRFRDGEEILPGISAYATNGHTPGHTSYEVQNGSESVLIIGDAINNTLVSVPHPEWHAPFDQDQAQAVITRKQILDRASHEKMAVIGYHFDEEPFGYIEKNGDGFRYVAG